MTDTSTPYRTGKLSLASKILIGFGLGVMTGVFLGELTAPLQVVSKTYLRLMQMTVIPYIAVALITGLGQLELFQAKQLAVRLGLLVLLFWAMAFVIIVLMPMTFPEWRTGAFFSTSLVEPKRSFNFIELYIPANPFHALAHSLVPAVVFFAVSVGVALIGIEKKETLIDGLLIFLRALSRVTKFVVGLTPIGVFAIGAVVAGTMSIEDFSRLQVYFVVFIVAALLLSFWVLPGLIAAITPFKYKDIFIVTKDALITAFVTHSLFIVIPILIEHSKHLMNKYQVQTEDSEKLVEVIIPVTFNFPNVGKLLSLLFVPFTAWLAGSPIDIIEYPGFFLTGVLSYFAKAQTALPFLMDLFEIPQDLFQLYIPTAIINGKFDTLLAAINLIAFSLIGTGALSGYLSFKPARILRYLFITAVVVMIALASTGIFLKVVVDTTDHKKSALQRMQLPSETTRITVQDKEPPTSFMLKSQNEATLEVIKKRGLLKVGYRPDNYPFSFYNQLGNLVGFDVELSIELARDMGVQLEYIPTSNLNRVGAWLESGKIDLALNIPYLPAHMNKMELSEPYLEGTVCLIVEDHRRHEFASLASIQNLSTLTLGSRLRPEDAKREIERLLPNSEINFIQIRSNHDFLKKKITGIDAVLEIAEAGMAWTLLYPEYSVVFPKPYLWKIPLGYAVAIGNKELVEYLDDWMLAKKGDGSIRQAYNYWVLGKGAANKKKRWSIIRNVMKWVQ